jgi:FtsH-binding integral membrane protein
VPGRTGTGSADWGSQTAEKVAIFGALSLYLDFVNLFQFLMMFLGQRR